MTDKNKKSKRRKIIKIEDIKRDPKNFVIRPKIGKYEIRSKYRGDKIEIPMEDKIRSTAKSQNTCVCCSSEACRLVHISIKGGGTKLERYCQDHFESLVNLERMELSSDDSYLEKIIIKPSEGQTRAVEDWVHLVKKGAHF